MKKKILFLINPKAGTKSKQTLPELIHKNLDSHQFDAEIKFTEYAGHASQLTKEMAGRNFDIIAAVGGDGTMNEVASELVNKKTALALIPTGSGNALARYLGISMNTEKAIRQISTGRITRVDACKADEKYFFNAAGVGFDAKVAHLFAKGKQRGFWGYFFIILKEFFAYRPQKYVITLDGIKQETVAFLIAFANSNQYGNEFVIAPKADIRDGMIEVVIIRNFPLLLAPYLFLLMLFNKQHWSGYFSIYRAGHILVESGNMKQLHLDGEPAEINNRLEIQSKPLSLSVLIP